MISQRMVFSHGKACVAAAITVAMALLAGTAMGADANANGASAPRGDLPGQSTAAPTLTVEVVPANPAVLYVGLKPTGGLRELQIRIKTPTLPATVNLRLASDPAGRLTFWSANDDSTPANQITTGVVAVGNSFVSVWVRGESVGQATIGIAYTEPNTQVTTTLMNVPVVVIKVEIESPYDTDANGKIDDPDNEFSFDTSSPALLQIPCQAFNSPGSDPDKFRWEIEDVGAIKGVWDPHVDGDPYTGKGLSSTVTFTGMPEHNADFGRKKITLNYEGLSCSDEEYVEVFFDPKARNNPGPPGETPPGTIAMEDLIE
jgi:hypothetical protein